MPPPDPSTGTEPLPLPSLIEMAVLAHAEWCQPDEACGLLAVDSTGNVRMAYSLTNSEPGPTRFTIAPEEHFGALTHAESRGWEIGGVFHSHPGGAAVPSPTDLDQPHDPLWFHLLVGFTPSLHVRAWRIDHGHAREVTLRQT